MVMLMDQDSCQRKNIFLPTNSANYLSNINKFHSHGHAQNKVSVHLDLLSLESDKQ